MARNSNVVDENIFSGKKKQAEGTMREHWGEITNDRADVWRGRYEQLIGRMQERYGYTRRHAEDELAERIAQISESLVDTKDAAVHSIQETTQKAATAVDETVTEHHWKSVFIALAIGVLIGWFARSNNGPLSR